MSLVGKMNAPRLFVASGVAALWWMAFRNEYLPFRGGYVSSLVLLSLAGLGLEALRALVRPAPGGRAASVFAALRSVLFATLVLGICASFLSHAIETGKDFASILENPYAVNIIEGGQVLRAWLVARGQPIYTDLAGYPCLLTIYAPLYYLVTGLFASLSPSELFAGRLVSAMSFAAAILFIGLLYERREKRPLLAFLLCLYLWQFQNFMSFARYARVDMLAWGLFFLSAWLLARGCEASGRGNRMLALAAMTMVLGALTKQQIAPLALPCAAYAAYRRRRLSPVLRYYVLPGLVLGAAVLLAARLYFGDAFFLNAVTLPRAVAADPNLNSTANMSLRLKDFFDRQPLFVLAYAAYAATSLFARQVRLLDFVMVIQLPLLILSLRWWGADSNYFIGPIFMMASGGAVFIKRLAGFPRFGPFLACALTLFLVPSKMNVMYEIRHFQDFSAPSGDAAKQITAILNGTNGPALVESEVGYLALSDKAFYFDAVEIANMSRYDLWRFAGSRLEKDILDVRFPVILNSSTFVIPEIREAVEAGYFKEKSVGKADVFLARPAGFRFSMASLEQEGPVKIAMQNLARLPDESCYAPQSQNQPGRLTLTILSSNPITSIALRFFPRINAENHENAVRLSWSVDGERYEPLYDLAGDGKGDWSPAFDLREERSVHPDSRSVYFRFELTGKAQLWMDQKHTMTFWIKE